MEQVLQPVDPLLDSIQRAVERIRENSDRLNASKEVRRIATEMWELVDRIEGTADTPAYELDGE